MSGGFGAGGFGYVPWGGSSPLGESSSATFTGNAACVPITPGTFRLIFRDNLGDTEMAYDASGLLIVSDAWLAIHPTGSISGTINYRTGEISVTFSPATSGSVGMSYTSAEGGCPPHCGACKTHHFRMHLYPGFDVGRNQTDVTDAYRRFIDKLNDIKPIHTDWLPTIYEEEFSIDIEQDLYDVIAADVRHTDNVSISVGFED